MMINKVGNSRIDGFPIFSVPKTKEGELFIGYFKSIEDEFYVPVDGTIITKVDGSIDSECMYIKIHLSEKYFNKQFSIFKKTLRLEKLKKLIESNEKK